jgi:ADP-ribosyl-[dinitrogen reductase] hydrolase
MKMCEEYFLVLVNYIFMLEKVLDILPSDHRITSRQKPYEVVHIAKIKDACQGSSGNLSLSFSPGKKDHHWNRDLKADLKKIRAADIQIIVCLLPTSEMKRLKISHYPEVAAHYGITFYHLPIPDAKAPKQKEINILIPLLIKHLKQGHNILVHCRGGFGRAGTVCACCLGYLGYLSVDAITIIRALRPGAIQTSAQEMCVHEYCKHCKHRKDIGICTPVDY